MMSTQELAGGLSVTGADGTRGGRVSKERRGDWGAGAWATRNTGRMSGTAEALEEVKNAGNERLARRRAEESRKQRVETRSRKRRGSRTRGGG
jgi:isoaspartyl peptidase/L-asparaginase-like protein (Ntn-hydrolase superfamily)